MDQSYLLSAINPLISITLFVTFLSLWVRQGEKRHVLNWTLAYACAGIGSSVDFARVLVENAVPLTFVANVFLVGVAFFAVRGATIRHSGQSLDRYTVPVYGVALAVGTWFTFVESSVTWRGTASSVGAAIMFVIAARVIWKDKQLDIIGHLTAWAFVMSAVTLLARPAVSYIYEGPLETEAQLAGSLWVVSFKIFAMLSWFACAILFLLRITADLMKEISAQSLIDPLTDIPNRRGFFAAIELTVQKGTPALPVTLAICDIDRFKLVNDTYGHQTGDLVIHGFADVLRRAAEDTGCIIGRLGGEEFVVVLPNTNAAGGRAFAEGIRIAFAAQTYERIPSSHVITVSIGIAESTGGESSDTLMERADGALYTAKRGGRNRVEVAVPLRAAEAIA